MEMQWAQEATCRPFGSEAPSTTAVRVGTWRRFRRFLLARGSLPPSVRSLRSWAASLLARDLKPSYISNEMSRVTVVLRARYSVSAADERRLVNMRAQIDRLKPFFTTRQAYPARRRHVRLIQQLRPHARETLFVQLLWAAAARPSDLSRLCPRDVSFPRPLGVQVTFRLTKAQQTGSVRTAIFYLPLSLWLRLRRLVSLSKPSRPFLPIDVPTINNFLRSLPLPHLTSYSFRRGAVQAMLDADVPPREVCRLTGHKDTKSLLIYADRVPPRAWAAMTRAAAALW